MSQFCKTQLCSTVQNVVTGIENTCDTTDILFSSFSVDRIEPTNRISKVTFNDLPDANTVPNGHVAYLDDAKVPVIASNCSWIGFDGRVLGTCVENQLWAWGAGGVVGGSDFLGDGSTTCRCSPVREFSSSTDWCVVSASGRGGGHTAAIKSSGQLWGWGSGLCGALGEGVIGTRCSPVREQCLATDWCEVSVGNCYTAAIKTSGQLWSWGLNSCGRLGDGTTVDKCSPIREFCSATDWCQVSAGDGNTSAIKASNELWSWGINFCGGLGDGTTVIRCSPVREFCSATDWCQVSFTSAIKTSGQIWAWGDNTCGRLGDGTTVSKCSPVREICSATDWCQVSASTRHTAAIKTSGQLWTWGRGNCGKLGNGTITIICSPVREICSATDWCRVSAAYRHTAAIKTSGQLWTWGSNLCGTLGDGTVIDRCSPVREFCSATDWCVVSAGGNNNKAVKVTLCICR